MNRVKKYCGVGLVALGICWATVMGMAQQVPSSAPAAESRAAPRPLPSAEQLRKLPPDGRPEFNRLVFEKSPYLLQHARRNRLVLLAGLLERGVAPREPVHRIPRRSPVPQPSAVRGDRPPALASMKLFRLRELGSDRRTLGSYTLPDTVVRNRTSPPV